MKKREMKEKYEELVALGIAKDRKKDEIIDNLQETVVKQNKLIEALNEKIEVLESYDVARQQEISGLYAIIFDMEGDE